MAGADLAFRKDAGGHLIEQGLEGVVVGPVDDRDPHRRPLERAGGEEPAEPAADDDHVVQPVAGARCAGSGPGRGHSSRSTTIWT